MKYRIFDHTADFGIEVYGTDPEQLFTNAAHALSEALTDISRLEDTEIKEIQIMGADWPDLLVNWLRELLSLWTVEDMLVKGVEIKNLKETELTATVEAALFDPDRYNIKEEIKAVTYHQADVLNESTGWRARVIFDV